MIEGVEVKSLKVIPDDRGFLMECLRNDDDVFDSFGQVYISAVYNDVVKAWHYHKKQTDMVVCVSGMIKLVLYDDRDGSSTNGDFDELYIGEKNPVLVKIPPFIWHGWMGLDSGLNLVMNCPTIPYDRECPDEFRMSPKYNPDSVGADSYLWQREWR